MTFYRKLDAGAARIAAILDERGRGAPTGGQCEPRPEQRPEILAGGGRQIAGQKVFLTVNQTRH